MGVLLISLLPSHSIRRVKERYLEFFKGESKEVRELNRKLLEFISSLKGSNIIYSILGKELLKGERHAKGHVSYGAYKFDILTNKGIISVIIKPIKEDEAYDFRIASSVDVTPHPVKFIPSEYEVFPYIDGYLVYPYFEGEKLSKICSQENGAQIIKENSWIIEQLAIKFARLKYVGVNYEDFFYYNTLINLKEKKLVITDFGKENCAEPIRQIKEWWLAGLFYNDSDFREKAVELFDTAYQKELERLRRE
jgi:serine/threonine protein kinase